MHFALHFRRVLKDYTSLLQIRNYAQKISFTVSHLCHRSVHEKGHDHGLQVVMGIMQHVVYKIA